MTMATQRKQKLPRLFVEMLNADASLDQLQDVCSEIDEASIWRSALDAVVRHKQTFPVSVLQKFLSLWATFGGGMRTDTGDDRLLINALRKLLPPYEGSDMVLYRSETRENRDHQTYGISWSAQPGLAKSMVKEDAPRVLLKANVPANAIMAEIRNDDDRYAENEFLVDRTALPENAVQVVRSPPKPFAA